MIGLVSGFVVMLAAMAFVFWCEVTRRRPGILFWLIYPSAIASALVLVAMVSYAQWFFAAWAACSVAASIAALRWAWTRQEGE